MHPFHMKQRRYVIVSKHLKKDLRRRPFINERIIFHDHHAICLFVYVSRSCVRSCLLQLAIIMKHSKQIEKSKWKNKINVLPLVLRLTQELDNIFCLHILNDILLAVCSKFRITYVCEYD